MATHCRILAWRIPGTEEPGGLQFKGSQRVGHDLATEHIVFSSLKKKKKSITAIMLKYADLHEHKFGGTYTKIPTVLILKLWSWVLFYFPLYVFIFLVFYNEHVFILTEKIFFLVSEVCVTSAS